jgi:acyl carrier protein
MVRKHYGELAFAPTGGEAEGGIPLAPGFVAFILCLRPLEISLVNQSQILDQVSDIIRDVLDVHDAKSLKIDAETTADQTEGWDSFNHINIVVAIEQHFGVKFKTAEIEQLRNVGELVALIARKLGV